MISASVCPMLAPSVKHVTNEKHQARRSLTLIKYIRGCRRVLEILCCLDTGYQFVPIGIMLRDVVRKRKYARRGKSKSTALQIRLET